MAWGRLFIFEETRANVLVYFSVLSIILMLGPEKIMPSLRQRSDAPVINAPAGDIGGDVMTTRGGRTIYAYKGIPYAEAPVGPLRFQKTRPLKAQHWDGVWNGKSAFRKCVQPTGISIYPFMGDEDCLFLNVYVPPTLAESEDGLPVMVWFHGGGFVLGDGSDDINGPGYLLDKDVILVTVNYRLGVFGFLNLAEEEVPGNQALWDQLEALKWVQRNIHAFGGLRKKVTIFGESAGGFSVSYHLASRKSKGHFSAAIVQSGPLQLPAFKTQKPLQQMHEEFIDKIGCKSDRRDATLKCLRDKPVSEFISEMNMFDQCFVWPEGLVHPMVWAPEDDSSFMKDSFFAQDPLDVFKKGAFNKVPTMIGATKDEGLLYTATYPVFPENYKNAFQTNWKECASKVFLGIYDGSIDASKRIKQIEEFYFKHGVSFDEVGMKNLSDAAGDSGFLYGTDLLAKQLAKETETYYYHYDHLGTYSAADFFGESKAGLIWKVFKMTLGLEKGKQRGASHGDELMYLLKPELLPFSLSEEKDLQMIDFMTTLWSNFATNHKPTNDDSWPPYNLKSGQSYVRLSNSQILNTRDPDRDHRLQFWDKIFHE